MVGYSLWTNWTTQYLVDAHSLTVGQAAWYAWIPPFVAMGGGFAGGWLSLRIMRGGTPAAAARFRVCFAAALLSLVTAAIPAAPTPAWAIAGISVSFFAVSAFSVNTYTLPLDTFGAGRAAFAISMLVASYGIAQLVVSPAFGALIDHYGYTPVTTFTAFTPLAACAVLWGMRSAQ
jgi:ACS family hexuronate transporter-like MFS transporter